MGRRPPNTGWPRPGDRNGRPHIRNNQRNYNTGSSRYPSVGSSWQNNRNDHQGRSTAGRYNERITCNGANVGNLRGAPPPSREIFIQRVETKNVKDVEEYMKLKNMNTSNIQKTSHPDSLYSSYKISVSLSDQEKVLNASFWPSGIQCRRWYQPKQNTTRYDHPYNIYSDSDNDSENEGDEEIENNTASDNASVTNNTNI